MREIKFRAWNGKNIYRVEWCRWILFGSPEEISGIRVDKDGQNEWKTLREPILMQFIGLKDKNGKEIYEGDIVEYKDIRDSHTRTEVVEYNQKSLMWTINGTMLSRIRHEQTHEGWKKSENWKSEPKQFPKIIGNKYENPNLLIK